MPSPFPGMDPYLEQPAFWSDFHATFINYWREALADRLPDAYEVRIDERVNFIEIHPEKIRRIEPDLVISPQGTSLDEPATSAGVATLEPVTVPLAIEEEVRETYIEILHRPERSLVAVLELLSPSNKEGPGRGAYLAKRNAILQHPVHLVEVDLLLAGRRLPVQGQLPPGDYYAFVAPGDRRPDCDVYAWTVRRPLPAIPVPLRPPDPPVWSDLAAVFATAYERGRYARSLDYAAPPPASLPEDQLAWARERARGNTP